jgi:iron complex transport system substrate-binding protein
VYRTRLDALRAARPDVILTQVQCASGALSMGDALAALRAVCPREGDAGAAPLVVQLEAESLEGAWCDVGAVARALRADDAGAALVARAKERIWAAAAAARGRGPPRRAALVQWTAPLFLAGGWVPDLIRAAGGADACAVPPGGASLQMTPEQLCAAAPEVVILALCGLGMDAAASEAPSLAALLGAEAWAALPAVRRDAVFAADAVRLFSRASPRYLADTVELLAEVLHPEAQPHGHAGVRVRRVRVSAAQIAAAASGTGEHAGLAAGAEAAAAPAKGAAQQQVQTQREYAYI